MNWTWVPVIGFIKNAVAIHRAQHLYDICHAAGGSCWAEYDATWPVFDEFTRSYVVTACTLVCVVGIVRILIILLRKP